MVSHRRLRRIRRWLIVASTAAAVLTVGGYVWLAGDAVGGAADSSTQIDFDVHNGEIGEVTTEVRVDEGAVQTVTARCRATEDGKPNVCRMTLSLQPGKRVLTVRTMAAAGWTPWSPPTTVEIK
jgi:hypothetical protein